MGANGTEKVLGYLLAGIVAGYLLASVRRPKQRQADKSLSHAIDDNNAHIADLRRKYRATR